MWMLFADRQDAGKRLASALAAHKGGDLLVLAVPRGGVVVGYQVARELGAELDVVIPRKLGAPHNPELAIGAVADDGSVCLDEQLVLYLGVTGAYLEKEVARQLEEINRRREQYRGNRPAPQVRGRTVIVVDDGVATGSTIAAAIRAVRSGGPARLVLAVPVGPPETLEKLGKEVDELVYLAAPEPFYAVGQFYRKFGQTTDAEVIALLAEFAGPPA